MFPDWAQRSTQRNALVDELNGLAARLDPPRQFAACNVSELNVSSFAISDRQRAADLQRSIVTISDEQALLHSLRDGIVDGLSQCVRLANESRTRAVRATENINLIEAIAEPFIQLTRRVVSISECGFLGALYRTAKQVRRCCRAPPRLPRDPPSAQFLCANVLNNLAVLSLTLFMIAFIGGPIICLSNIAAKRVPHPVRPTPQR